LNVSPSLQDAGTQAKFTGFQIPILQPHPLEVAVPSVYG